MRAEVEWVDARERLPESGTPVAAAITGRYTGHEACEHEECANDPDRGQEFWLVRPMYFTTLHFAEDGREYHDCFVDSDEFVRLPYGRAPEHPQDLDEPITHWAELPTLPGTTVHRLTSEEAKAARANALGERA